MSNETDKTSGNLVDGVATFTSQTDGIAVTVQSCFLPQQSCPEQNHFTWAYRILITNNSKETVQLLTRHWIITDALGRRTEVEGEGVVGKQPVLSPGDSHAYSSGTPLATPTGFMTGSYGMCKEDGTCFRVAVPTFSLDSPYHQASLN